MDLSPSAHVDTFCREHLPPPDQWPEFRFDVPEVHYPDRLSCATELLDAMVAELGPDRPCLLAPGAQAWTYGDLLASSNRIANLLVDEHGIVPGNRVLLRGPNNPLLVACWFAVLKAGAVVVTTMPLLRPRELATIDEIASIDLSLCDHRFVDDLETAGLAARTLVYGGADADDLVAASAGRSDSFQNVETAADDVALLAFTSGTTGRPKATMHFHRDVLANADTFSHYVLKPTRGRRVHRHPAAGLHLRAGRSGGVPAARRRRHAADREGHPGGARPAHRRPPGHHLLHGSDRVPGDAGGWRRRPAVVPARGGVGRRAPAAATWQAFEAATGVQIINGIGSTEMLHIFIGVVRSTKSALARRARGARVRRCDRRRRRRAAAPSDRSGRLAVRGPTGCRYLADSRQLAYVQDGWNITGDTFSRDADGYFWYQARSDDMIVSSGYNIAAPEVEEALLRAPRRGRVRRRRGRRRGARHAIVKAFVVLREGVDAGDAKVRELQDFVKQQIAPYKYPRAVEFVDELPRTATGKLQRFRLRDSTIGA